MPNEITQLLEKPTPRAEKPCVLRVTCCNMHRHPDSREALDVNPYQSYNDSLVSSVTVPKSYICMTLSCIYNYFRIGWVYLESHCNGRRGPSQFDPSYLGACQKRPL
jgi:hypothetical protein